MFRLGLVDGTPTIEFSTDTFEEDQSSAFKYEPDKIDAVYLEFIATIDLILNSPAVGALRTAIAADLGSPHNGRFDRSRMFMAASSRLGDLQKTLASAVSEQSTGVPVMAAVFSR